jgi:hypothetical protein
MGHIHGYAQKSTNRNLVKKLSKVTSFSKFYFSFTFWQNFASEIEG